VLDAVALNGYDGRMVPFFSRCFVLCLVGWGLVSCSEVQPAGSLGYTLDGDTRLRPTPQNYRHVPPRLEDANPTPTQWMMKF